jgi:hypothetical protein
MAYDEKLAARIRTSLRSVQGLSEREQFGGIAFLLRGNVACGVLGNDLLVRVGPGMHDEAMKSKAARPFSFTGRPSRGWVLVRPAGLGSAAALRNWLELGVAFAKSLPAK